MKQKSMADLQRAAVNGPVVILHAGVSSCCALVLKVSGEVHCVPLAKEITLRTVNGLAQCVKSLSTGSTPQFESLLATLSPGRGHDSVVQNRLLGTIEGDVSPTDQFRTLLEILWSGIAAPVIRALGLKKSVSPSRLWWCPTGPFAFLPIHAAGIYSSEMCESVADYVVSSYTPTLTALLTPPSIPSTVDNPLKVTAVIQPQTPDHSPLPYTADDFGTPQSPASVERVLAHLKTSSIVHFACHGTQDPRNPLDSALLIGDGRLKVAQIMEQSGASHDATENYGQTGKGLVFLSACETAMGDTKVPDEAMHLAATLLFAGFRSVVATMWTMQDPDGPEIAEAFYGHLFRNADATHPDAPVFPDTTDSAHALHLAVAKLRPKVPFARWVPFVHFGL
ncbi:CHAT domain-containing protein [Mycena sp. CBHHK59/15]|nr:CHAT domain-containing protein [Mycena sp. CBHHK59/15]